MPTKAKAKQEGPEELAAIELGHSFISLKGMSPLIMGKFTEQKKGKDKGALLTREAVAEAQVYYDKDGEFCIPSSAIKNALVAAGGRFTTNKMTILRGALQIPTPYIKIKVPSGTYEVEDFGVVNRSSGKTIAHRPVFYDWETEEFEVMYVANAVSHEMLKSLISYAGFTTGVGVYRVEKNGTFGMFHLQYEYDAGLTKFSVTKETK